MREKNQMQQRVRVLAKLYDSGCTTEKELQALHMEAMLKIPGITIADMTTILELQKHTKAGKLFSYLGGVEDDKNGSGQTGHLE